MTRKNPARVSPRMIMNKGKGLKYHIIIEQLVICEVDSFAHCLFIWLVSFIPINARKCYCFFKIEQPDNF